jgi:Transcriptional regulators
MNKEDRLLAGFRDIYNKTVCLNKSKMEARLTNYKPSEVHCIEYIGKNADANVTKLAESFYMTRGAASKITQKLIGKGLIESYQKPDNKKEIYFKLTEQGKAISKVHDDLHKEFLERDKIVFDQINEEQWENMLSFVEKYNRHLDAEIQKSDADVNKPE